MKAVISLFLLVSTAAPACDAPSFVRSITVPPPAGGVRPHLSAMTISADGTIYATDDANHKVVRISPNGGTQTWWGTMGSGQLQFSSPRGITMDGNGVLWVGDFGNNRVQRISTSGGFIGSVGTLGTGNAQFRNPWGVGWNAVNSQIYVADYEGNRVQKFTPAGAFVGQFGSAGAGTGQTLHPSSLSFDSLGYIYLLLEGTNRIKKFDSAGNYSRAMGPTGSNPGQFSQPASIASDPGNGIRIFISDGAAGVARASTFSIYGDLFNTWTGGPAAVNFTAPAAIAIDRQYQLYIADTAEGAGDSTNTRIAVFLALPDPRVVSSPPAYQHLPDNSSVTLTCVAAGSGTLTYKLYGPAGTGLLGTNNTGIFTLNNLTAANAGRYAIDVTSDCGGTFPPMDRAAFVLDIGVKRVIELTMIAFNTIYLRVDHVDSSPFTQGELSKLELQGSNDGVTWSYLPGLTLAPGNGWLNGTETISGGRPPRRFYRISYR